MAQIGTIRIETASGPVDVPVFDTGDVALPVVRVQTPSGVGALNLVDPADADIDYLRFQTGQGVKAVASTVGPDWYDGFEDGVLTDTWTNNHMSIVTDRTNSGTYSIYSNTDGETTYMATIDPFVNGNEAQPTRFEYYYNETSSGYGGGVQLYGASGYELGIATDNPQWYVDDGNGQTELDPGTDYNRWVRVRVNFDWNNNQYDIEFYDATAGKTYGETGRPLKVGSGFQTLEIQNFNGDTDGFAGSGNFEMWFDDYNSDDGAQYSISDTEVYQSFSDDFADLDVWTVTNGSYSTSNSYVSGSGGSPAKMYTSKGNEVTGDWSVVNISNGESFYGFKWGPVSDSTDYDNNSNGYNFNWYQYRDGATNGKHASVISRDGGSGNVIFTLTTDHGGAGARNNGRFTRDGSGNMEGFYNGSSVGTTTDNTVTDSSYYAARTGGTNNELDYTEQVSL